MVVCAAVFAGAESGHRVFAATRRQRHNTRVVIWTDARGGGALQVRLDGRPVGVLAEYFTAGPPSCAHGRGVLVADVATRALLVDATDEAGRRWRRRLMVNAGGCVLVRLGPRDAVNGSFSIPAESAGATSDEYPIPAEPVRNE